MKLIFIISLFSLSFSIKANSLIGEWVNCEAGEDGLDTEHRLIFEKNNVEFEVHGFTPSNKNKPCSGNYQLLVGTYWHYEENNSQFTSTAFSHYIILGKESAIATFNKEKLCGVSDWKLNSRVECTDDKSLRDDLPRRGKKTTHEFIRKGNELHIIDDGKTYIYHKQE